MDTQNAITVAWEPNEDDIKVIGAWLLTKQSENTRRAYRRIAMGLLAYTHKHLADMTLFDAQEYINMLEGENSSIALATNVLKSLATFQSNIGHGINFGKMLKPPAISDELANRILSEAEVIRMIDRETNPRNHAMIHLLYHAGLRVSEVVALTWEHIRESDHGAILDITLAKGGKSRRVLISADMYNELLTLRGAGAYVFQSRKNKSGLPMLPRQVDNIVLEAAKRAGIDKQVSAHWLRHSHASHATNNGAKPGVLQNTLGHKSLLTTMRYVHLNPDESSSQFIKV